MAAAVVAEALRPRPGGSPGAVDVPGLNGLVVGVGLEVFGRRDKLGWGARPLIGPEGENLLGSVPALVLLPVTAPEVAWRSCRPEWLKSGKLSPLGDSGMVSRSGVELPLVGGCANVPQI